MPESTVSKSPSGWVHGLDELRFISAVWVVFSHLPFPDPVAAVEKGTWFGTAAFYFPIERPSHRFARWAGRALAPPRTPRPVA